MAEEREVIDFDDFVEYGKEVTRISKALDILKAIRSTAELYYTFWDQVEDEEEEQYGVTTALSESMDVTIGELNARIEDLTQKVEELLSKMQKNPIDIKSVNEHFSKEETPAEKMERIIREIYEEG